MRTLFTAMHTKNKKLFFRSSTTLNLFSRHQGLRVLRARVRADLRRPVLLAGGAGGEGGKVES